MIPVARPAPSDSDLAGVAEVFASRWLGQGKVTQEFEEAVAAHLGGRRVVLATDTGTTAMHLALEALGVGPGDEVVLPSLTFVATTQAVVAAGATPVLCDVRRDTLAVDVESLERVTTERTRAVMPVHYRGTAVEIDPIVAWAHERGIRVVEDAAHAFGSRYEDGTPVGGKGDVTCFSFDPIKNITTGEGGAIVFGDEGEADRARKMAVLGIDSTAWGRLERRRPWSYDVVSDGWRYHMPNFCAAVGLSQLQRIEEFRATKQGVAARYEEAFAGLDAIEMPPLALDRTLPFLALVLVEEREDFMLALRERGIGTGVHYIPSHHFTRFADAAPTELPVTDWLADRICSLPLLNDQTPEETEAVVEAVCAVAAELAPVG